MTFSEQVNALAARTGSEFKARDSRYVKTVNGTAPDSSGNVSVPGGVTSTTITIIWTGTQAQYNALGVKDPATLYVIVER